MTMIIKKPVKYFMVDAFSESAFKGNPAVVCFLDEKKNERDESWLQSLAAEFNIPLTCFVIPITDDSNIPPHFFIRWFTPTHELDICAHATLAAAHIIFSNELVGSELEIKFSTCSGILTATKRVSEQRSPFSIELDFPVIPTCEFESSDISMFTKAFNGATIVDVMRGTSADRVADRIIVVLKSWESVTQLQPRMDDISNCPGNLIIVTAAAPQGSLFDFCSRIFAPTLGVNEDSVCGSAHCALAHYWSIKMNKFDFVAYAASRRSGTLKVHYDKKNERVLLTGKAVTVMAGTVLV